MSHFEGRDKLDGAKVFGPLCDDSCDLLGGLQVHLKTQKHRLYRADKLRDQSAGLSGPHLQPLRLVVGGGGPGVRLALFVQPGVVRVPGEGLNPPCAEGAGRRDLAVGYQAGLHTHWL